MVAGLARMMELVAVDVPEDVVPSLPSTQER